MSIDVIQAEYDKLDDIAGRFAKSAESTADMRSRIEQSVQALQSGKWEGEGSTAFFTEMERDVFPVMTRLAGALEQAQSVTLQAKDILQAAEDEAARPFGASDTVTKERGHVVPASGSAEVTDPDIYNSPYYDQAVRNIKYEEWNPFDGDDFSYDSQEEYEWLLRREIAVLEDHDGKYGVPGNSVLPEKAEHSRSIAEQIGDFFIGDRDFRTTWGFKNGPRP